jgi:hypothetical protein
MSFGLNKNLRRQLVQREESGCGPSYTLQSCKDCCETNSGLERGLLEKYLEKTRQFVEWDAVTWISSATLSHESLGSANTPLCRNWRHRNGCVFEVLQNITVLVPGLFAC